RNGQSELRFVQPRFQRTLPNQLFRSATDRAFYGDHASMEFLPKLSRLFESICNKSTICNCSTNLPNLISFICLFPINMQPLALFLRKEPGGLSSISGKIAKRSSLFRERKFCGGGGIDPRGIPGFFGAGSRSAAQARRQASPDRGQPRGAGSSGLRGLVPIAPEGGGFRRLWTDGDAFPGRCALGIFRARRPSL